MCSMKSNKIGASSNVKKTNTGPSKSKGSSRTYKNNESTDVVGTVSGEVGGLLKFVGKKLGSFFYEYYELAAGITNLIKNCGVGIWNGGRSFLGYGKSSVLVEVKEQSPKNSNKVKVSEVYKPHSDPDNQITHLSSIVAASDKISAELEKPQLNIDENEIAGLSNVEIAKLLIQKSEYCDNDKKVFLLLNDIADEFQIKDVVRYFSAAHYKKKTAETIDEVIARARKALNSFLKKRTNNPELVHKIIEILFAEPLVEVQMEANADSNDIFSSQPLISEVNIDEPFTLVLSMKYTSDVSDNDLRQIRAFAEVIDIDDEVVDGFLELIFVKEETHSNLSKEDVILKMGFLKALSESKLINQIHKLPDNLFSLEEEYGHYLIYCRNSEKMKRDISNLLGKSSNHELHSYSIKREIAAFLTAKEKTSLQRDAITDFESLFGENRSSFSRDDAREVDAMTKAKRFIKDLVTLDTNGVDGVLRLFRKAVEREKEDSCFVFGYYNKAEVTVSLLQHFERLKIQNPKTGDFRMTVFPDSSSNEDVLVETNDTVYLIKIKSNFERAVAPYDIDKMKTFAKNIRAKQAFTIFETSSGKGKAMFPVCVVKNAGNTLIDLENRVINEKNKKDFIIALRELLAIQRENEKFQIWDINGNDISMPLRKLLGVSASSVFDSTQVA